jgi:predicted DNA-binding transcriptional regulator AlpA
MCYPLIEKVIEKGMELLRPKDVAKRMKISRAYLYKLIKKGLFPRPVKALNGTMSVWLSTEVDSLIEAIYRMEPEEKIRELVKTIENKRHFSFSSSR